MILENIGDNTLANISLKYLKEIDLKDNFFNSLREDYKEFDNWFLRKATEDKRAFTFYENHNLIAFLSLKIEEEIDDNIKPNMKLKKRLKVSTFKIIPHRTKLGERFVKRIFDIAIKCQIDEIYVTIFSKHEGLLNLLKIFGFYEYGTKDTKNGVELVLIKDFLNIKNNIILDYPIVNTKNKGIYCLSIYPKFHTRLFSDSILKNESVDIVKDFSHTNSIHKIYLSGINDVANLRREDILLIYRTNDGKGVARFRSVITSVCVIEEILNISNFKDIDSFLNYCEPHSIFTKEELISFYTKKRYPFVIKMTYNIALTKRVTNGTLIGLLGINPSYWGFFKLTEKEFKKILDEGKVNESLIVN